MNKIILFILMLLPGTLVYSQARKHSSAMDGSETIGEISRLRFSNGEITDQRDGNTYEIITIGDQTWFSENLRYYPRQDFPGDEPVEDDKHAYYVYNTEPGWPSDPGELGIYNRYGVLYSWKAAQGACPDGWRLPGDKDWKELERFLGMPISERVKSGKRGYLEGGMLKSTDYWVAPNNRADNSSNFSALPGGRVIANSMYSGLGEEGNYWSSSAVAKEYMYNPNEINPSDFWGRIVRFDHGGVERVVFQGMNAHSIRCIRETPYDWCQVPPSMDTHKGNWIEVLNVDFETDLEASRKSGDKYSVEMLRRDFNGREIHPILGDDNRWRAHLIGGEEDKDLSLRIDYPKDLIGTDKTGASFSYDFDGVTECALVYDFRFSPDFDWRGKNDIRGSGGKLPGLTSGGQTYTGGFCPIGENDGKGWSARYMWRDEGMLMVYLYWREMTQEYGHNLYLKEMPSEALVSITDGKWHTIEQRIKVNFDNSYNGILEVWLDGKRVYSDYQVNWRKDNLGLINSFYFSTIVGGSDPGWALANDGYIDFDNIKILLKGNNFPSLTKGVSSPKFGSGYQSFEITDVDTWRWAERYYGFRKLNYIRESATACGEKHIFLEGFTNGAMGEYLMKFGGDYNVLAIKGMADDPAPVELKVYIDGEYKTTTWWDQGNRCIDIAYAKIEGVEYGTHTLSVEFSNDYYDPAATPRVDRNFYLDAIKVISGAGLITDIDNNIYETERIGNQLWFSENLKTTRFNDGLKIPEITHGETWKNLREPAYCWYNNNKKDHKPVYGGLYNFAAVKTGKLCPEGWHVPSRDEWHKLINYLGGKDIAGGKMKEPGFSMWTAPNKGADNESGFSGRAGGLRSLKGYDVRLGDWGYWWSSTEASEGVYSQHIMELLDLHNKAMHITLLSHEQSVCQSSDYKNYGFSVRCIRDEGVKLPEGLTGGKPETDFGAGYQTNEVTEVNTWRWAERYYGYKKINEIRKRTDNCGEQHIYMEGFTNGAIGEYLMKFGDQYCKLLVRGIADDPSPVRLKIYIDGKYKATTSWNNGDGCNQSATVILPGIPLGTHAIAVEFVNDYYDPLPDPFVDRNLYLDALKVISINDDYDSEEGSKKSFSGSGNCYNYPNPFPGQTTISYYVPVPSKLEINIYNFNGSLINRLLSGPSGAGSFRIVWNGRNEQGVRVSPGLYICEIKADQNTLMRFKMVKE